MPEPTDWSKILRDYDAKKATQPVAPAPKNRFGPMQPGGAPPQQPPGSGQGQGSQQQNLPIQPFQSWLHNFSPWAGKDPKFRYPRQQAREMYQQYFQQAQSHQMAMMKYQQGERQFNAQQGVRQQRADTYDRWGGTRGQGGANSKFNMANKLYGTTDPGLVAGLEGHVPDPRRKQLEDYLYGQLGITGEKVPDPGKGKSPIDLAAERAAAKRGKGFQTGGSGSEKPPGLGARLKGRFLNKRQPTPMGPTTYGATYQRRPPTPAPQPAPISAGPAPGMPRKFVRLSDGATGQATPAIMQERGLQEGSDFVWVSE